MVIILFVQCMVHSVDDTAGGQEKSRLECRVRHQVHEPRSIGPHAEPQDHIAQLADGGVGQHFLKIELGDRDSGRNNCRYRPDVSNE